jgi:hypothetical protein
MSRSGFATLLLPLMACGTQPASVDTDVLRVAIHDGDNQTAIGNTSVAVVPVVKVTTADGSPRAGVMVRFEVTEGGGETPADPVPTDASGLASPASWKLGPPGVSQHLTAFVALAANQTVVFSASAITGPLYRLTTVDTPWPDWGEAIVGELLAARFLPIFIALDAGGNPVSGVTISMSTRNGGVIAPTSAVTGADGKVRLTSWLLGTRSGYQAIDVIVPDSAAPWAHRAGANVWTEPGPVATIEKLATDQQVAPAGATVAQAPRVRVRDQYGNPAYPRQVIFSVVSGGGSVDNTHHAAATDGSAGVGLWRLGPTPGENRLRVTAEGVSTEFVANGIP